VAELVLEETDVGEGKALPDGWTLLPFSEAARTISVSNNKVKQQDYLPQGKLPVIDQGQEYIGGYTDDVDKQVVCNLPVIVFGDHTKALKFVNFDFVAGADGVKVLKPIAAFDPKLFYYFLHVLELPDKGYARHFQYLQNSTIPLPPLTEQQRIVGEIEAQFTRLDAGVGALKRTRRKLQRYRASVLKAACEGRLVPQDPSDEPASTLLQRILVERRAQWEAAELAKMEAKGKRPKDDKWKEKYQEPTGPETEGLPELPEGWVWARAEQLSDWITKGTTPTASKLHHSASESAKVPFLKVYNLTFDGTLDFSVAPTFISDETHHEELGRSLVLPGDVLMNIVGPPLGKVSIVPDLYPEWNMNQAIVRYRPMAGFSGKFLSYLLRAETILHWAKSRAKATAGQFNLTLEICRDLPLPIPPQAEQQRIVEEVERRLSLIEAMEVAVKANLKRAERLRQSILKQAFAGKLVPQDPTNEPASVLLARLRAARNGGEKARQGRLNL
jgi:type I restriction enzyme S subunit